MLLRKYSAEVYVGSRDLKTFIGRAYDWCPCHLPHRNADIHIYMPPVPALPKLISALQDATYVS